MTNDVMNILLAI